MSSGDCIIISSDDDSDVITVSEKTEVVKPPHAIKKLTTKKLQKHKKNVNKNNQDSSLELNDNLLIKTIKVTGTKIQNPLNNCIQTGLDGKNSSECSKTVENNFQDYLSDTYKKFVTTVLSLEPEEEDKTRLLKKLNKYHNLADPEYIKSSEFNSLLENGLEKINDNPVYLYFVLKEVRDCLFSKKVEIKLKKKCSSKILSLAGNSNTLKNDGEGTFEDENYEDSAADEKNYKTVKKLTRLLRKLSKEIKKLEESEVDFSDEEGSNYFKMQRYRERYCRVYKKLCTYTTHPLNANRIDAFRKINFSGTQNLELNRAVEKWLNKERRFPDYADMLKLIEELNESLSLGLSNDQAKTQAEAIFKKIGDMLQRRRHFDLWESLSSFLDEEEDPAVKDPELSNKLQKNFDIGVQKEKEIFRYYVEQQEKEKLKPIEVPDEDADLSPVESGDEDEKEIAEVENKLSSAIKGEELTEESYEYETEIEETESLLDYKEENGMVEGYIKDEGGVGDAGEMLSSIKNSEESETMAEGNKDSISMEKFLCASTCETQTEESNCKRNEDSDTANKNDSVSVSKNNCVKIENEDMYNANRKISYSSNEIKISVLNTDKNTPNSDLEVICSISNPSCNHNDSVRSDHLIAIKREIEAPHLKRSLMEEGSVCVKKSKLDGEFDETSDTEIVEILSDDEENYVANEKNNGAVPQKTHHVNYAFVKSNLNYNAILSWDLFGENKFFFRDLKRKKNQGKSPNGCTLTDLTNIKNIANKLDSSKEIKLKRKRKIMPGMSKRPCSIKRSALERQRLKKTKFIQFIKNNISCPLQNGTGSESIKCQKEPDNISDSNNFQQGSNEEPVRSPNNGSSGGGNGQDNGENNGNKKPYDQEKQIDDNQEDEDDEEEDKETEKESTKEGSIKTNESNKSSFKEDEEKATDVPFAVPENGFAPDKLYVNEDDTKNEIKKNLPSSTYETVNESVENPKKSSSKVQKAPVTKMTRSRKRENNQCLIDKNGGIPGTSRQGFINMFSDIKFRKLCSTGSGPARKRSLNIPSSRVVDNANKIKAAKKRCNLPVKATQSDEEIVKNFLEGSHPSISITSPRKKTIQNEFSPSPSVLEAMATLSRLKGISATIVKGASKRKSDEDVTVIGESLSPRVNQMSKGKKVTKSSRPVENFDCVIPKIVTVHGNVSGFENMTNDSISDNEMIYQECVQNPEFCKINSGGNKPTNYNKVNSGVNDIPIPRFRNVQSRTRHKTPKNSAKKNVEYVVLD